MLIIIQAEFWIWKTFLVQSFWQHFINSALKWISLHYIQHIVHIGVKISCTIEALVLETFAELTWWNLSHCGGGKPLKCIWLVVSHKTESSPSSDFGSSSCTPCFSWRGWRFPLAMSCGLCTPGAVTVSLHTRMNLKKQVNCGSLPF